MGNYAAKPAGKSTLHSICRRGTDKNQSLHFYLATLKGESGPLRAMFSIYKYYKIVIMFQEDYFHNKLNSVLFNTQISMASL